MKRALREHWPEYLIEGVGLGLFMVSAAFFGTLLEAPSLPIRAWVGEAWLRRLLMGLIMGLTAVLIIYSPWGKRSGAHLNPAVTLSFLRLGKVERWDAAFYIVAQFTGGLAGILLVGSFLRPAIDEPTVRWVATTPGEQGVLAALAAETVISAGMMGMVLWASNSRRWNSLTGLFAGLLLATYITLEAPLSGMSINPARTVASAVPSGVWTAAWLYFVAPVVGMLLASELQLRLGRRRVYCAKLNHGPGQRCIFRCRFGELGASHR